MTSTILPYAVLLAVVIGLLGLLGVLADLGRLLRSAWEWYQDRQRRWWFRE